MGSFSEVEITNARILHEDQRSHLACEIENRHQFCFRQIEGITKVPLW